MPLLAVSANDIDAAGISIDAELPLPWLAEELADGSLTGVAPGHVAVRLSRSGKDGIVVRGKVKAELVTPCARCLDPARVSVAAEVTLLLTPGKPSKPAHAGHAGHSAHAGHGDARANGKAPAKDKDEEEYEFSSDEADVDHYDGETVVLDPFVREAILLEVPNFPLCSEDCAGIRPAARESAPEEAGLDPRLAPLAALREKLSRSQAAKRPSRPPAAPATPGTSATSGAPAAKKSPKAPGPTAELPPKKKKNKE
jgi:uncharacterized protein